MTKRIAIVIAGALIAAMMSGVVALTFGRGVVGAGASATSTPEPIVKTVTQVVTVRKRRSAGSGAVQVIRVVRPASGALGTTSTYQEEAGDREGGGDD
jgi:hypothetical protein